VTFVSVAYPKAGILSQLIPSLLNLAGYVESYHFEPPLCCPLPERLWFASVQHCMHLLLLTSGVYKGLLYPNWTDVMRLASRGAVLLWMHM
jgi:hypothetical protein